MKHRMFLRSVLTWPNLAVVAVCTLSLRAVALTMPHVLLRPPLPVVAFGLACLVGLTVQTSWLVVQTVRTRRAPPCPPVSLARLNGSTAPAWLTVATACTGLAVLASLLTSATLHLPGFLMSWFSQVALMGLLMRRQRLVLTERGLTVNDLAGRRRTISWDDVCPTWFCRGYPHLLILRDRSDGYTAPVLLLGRPLPLRTLLPSLQRYVDDPVARLELIPPATRRHTATPPPPDRVHAG